MLKNIVDVCVLIGFALWGNFASCLFKKFSPGGGGCCRRQLEVRRPPRGACGGIRGGGFGELVGFTRYLNIRHRI